MNEKFKSLSNNNNTHTHTHTHKTKQNKTVKIGLMFRYSNKYTVMHNKQLPLQFLHISVWGWGPEGS